MLLRDFAINFGVVSDLAKKFADDVYYFEQRLVNDIREHGRSEILTLGQAEKLATTVNYYSTFFFSLFRIRKHSSWFSVAYFKFG